MKKNILINGCSHDVARTLKSSYGKCEGSSMTLKDGHQIQGVLEYDKEE